MTNVHGLLHQRVLIRQGPRSGQKGIVSRECGDGTFQVDFPIGAGGGCEHLYYMSWDIEALGPETILQQSDPFPTAYGPYRYEA